MISALFKLPIQPHQSALSSFISSFIMQSLDTPFSNITLSKKRTLLNGNDEEEQLLDFDNGFYKTKNQINSSSSGGSSSGKNKRTKPHLIISDKFHRSLAQKLYKGNDIENAVDLFEDNLLVLQNRESKLVTYSYQHRDSATKKTIPLDEIIYVKAINLIFLIVSDLKLRNESAHLAVSYLDTYLLVSDETMYPGYKLLQLAVTCVWIASKMEEIHHPRVDDIIYSSTVELDMTLSDFVETEREISNALKYQFCMVNTASFKHIFMEIALSSIPDLQKQCQNQSIADMINLNNNTEQTRTPHCEFEKLFNYIIDILNTNTRLKRFKASTLCASALAVAIFISMDFTLHWSNALSYYSKLSLNDLKLPIGEVWDFFSHEHNFYFKDNRLECYGDDNKFFECFIHKLHKSEFMVPHFDIPSSVDPVVSIEENQFVFHQV